MNEKALSKNSSSASWPVFELFKMLAKLVDKN